MTDSGLFPMTVVCCVEPGPLEVGAVRLVESLRKWGGRLANVPLIAVMPPGIAALARDTRGHLDALNVRVIVRPRHAGYQWFSFINKPLAMVVAEEAAETEQICFLDSDILVIREPERLVLDASEDFAACAPEVEQGTRGPGDSFEPLWAELCKANRLALDELPWIRTHRTSERIRLYWNGGVFNVRRGKRFGEEYLAATERMLRARVRLAHPGFGAGICEQSAIGFAQVKLGLRWRHLPWSHNYNIGSSNHADRYRPEDLGKACLLHYHDSMWPPFFDTFLACLRATHPQVHRWLQSEGPTRNPAILLDRLIVKYGRLKRAKDEKRYLKTCKELQAADA
jgi:hypothetical protein